MSENLAGSRRFGSAGSAVHDGSVRAGSLNRGGSVLAVLVRFVKGSNTIARTAVVAVRLARPLRSVKHTFSARSSHETQNTARELDYKPCCCC